MCEPISGDSVNDDQLDARECERCAEQEERMSIQKLGLQHEPSTDNAPHAVGPESVAAVIERYPNEREAILRLLHRTRGSAFVREVLALVGDTGCANE